MKICVIYHPRSEHGRLVEEYAQDFNRTYSRPVELLSLETREGAAMASLYDVVRYPAVLALAHDGHLQKMWEGDQLPQMDEVAGYLAN